MIKFIGLLFIFTCFSYGGQLLAKREKERIEANEGMLLLIRIIRQNIACFRNPLDLIYQNFTCSALETGNFLSVLKEQGLKSAYLSEKDRFGYDVFTENRLIAFAESVGRLPLEEQVNSCDMLCDLLEEKIKEAKANYPAQKKLYQVLGISLGIAIVILFI